MTLKPKLLLFVLIFVALTALWWAAIWLALPIDWLQVTLPSLAVLHIAPPVTLVAAWWAGKRAWVWHKARTQKRVAAAETAKQTAKEATDKAAQQKTLAQRRAHAQCRAVWAEFACLPEWAKAGAEQCVLLEQPPKKITGTGSEAALNTSLAQVFEAAFQQCNATAWLTVILVGNDPSQQDLAGQAWHTAVARCGIAQTPQDFACVLHPGPDGLFERIVTMFETDPALPAVVVLGMASPLADAPPPQAGSLGHAVVAVLLSRPNLEDPGEPQPDISESAADDPALQPYWERNYARQADHPQWAQIPPPLRQGLWKLSPFATLHRPSTADIQELKRDSSKAQRVQNAIQQALADAGLHDTTPPPAQPGTQEEAEAPELINCLVHNLGSAHIPILFSALKDCGSEVNLFTEGCNLKKEHGDVGTAESVLALAEPLILAAQRQQPVMSAQYNQGSGFLIGFARPVPETPSPGAASPALEK